MTHKEMKVVGPSCMACGQIFKEGEEFVRVQTQEGKMPGRPPFDSRDEGDHIEVELDGQWTGRLVETYHLSCFNVEPTVPAWRTWKLVTTTSQVGNVTTHIVADVTHKRSGGRTITQTQSLCGRYTQSADADDIESAEHMDSVQDLLGVDCGRCIISANNRGSYNEKQYLVRDDETEQTAEERS